MRARSLRRFYDLVESTFREKGATFDVTPERFAEINSHANYGALVEEVPSDDAPVAAEMPARDAESDSEAPSAKPATKRRRTVKKAAPEPETDQQED